MLHNSKKMHARCRAGLLNCRLLHHPLPCLHRRSLSVNRLRATQRAVTVRLHDRMALRAVLCLAVVACFLHTSTAFDWQPCSNSSKYADIKDVSLKPESPAPGDTVKFQVHGTAKIDVSAGSLDIAVMYSGLPIFSETRDLCDMAACPIKTGPLEIDFDQYLPPIVPPGPYNVTLDAKSTNGQELLCLEVLFDVTPPFAARAASALQQKAAGLLRGHKAQA